MGVDVNSFVAYGAFIDNVIPRLYEAGCTENGSSLFKWDEEENEMQYNFDMQGEYDLIVINEPYSGDWLFMGIEFVEKDVDKTIENLKSVKVKWNAVIHQLISALPEGEKEKKELLLNLNPSIVEMSYFD